MSKTTKVNRHLKQKIVEQMLNENKSGNEMVSMLLDYAQHYQNRVPMCFHYYLDMALEKKQKEIDDSMGRKYV